MRVAILVAVLQALSLGPLSAATAQAPDPSANATGPEALVALRARAARLMDAGKNAEALPILDAIVRLAPDDGDAYNDRGLARWRSIDPYARAGNGFAGLQNRLCVEVEASCPRLDLAIADLGRAIELQSGSKRAVAYVDRAQILFALGDTRRALSDEDEALRLRPNEPRFFEGRAEMRLALGDRPGALADLDAALRLDDDTTLLARRAEVRLAAGDIGGARADVDEALRREPPKDAIGWSQRLHHLRRVVAVPGEPGMETELALIVSGAQVRVGPAGEPVLDVTLDADTAKKFALFSTAHVGSRTEFSIDGKELMSPIIREPIAGGMIQVTGNFSQPEVDALAARLNAHDGARIVVCALD